LNSQLGIYAHPIFTEEGDYPSVVKERVDANSQAEGFNTSRLPKFTEEEINFVKGKIRFTDKITYLIQLRFLSDVSIHTNTKPNLKFITRISMLVVG
jgi:hypothetical protein